MTKTELLKKLNQLEKSDAKYIYQEITIKGSKSFAVYRYHKDDIDILKDELDNYNENLESFDGKFIIINCKFNK